MKYIVIEIQTNADGTIGTLVNTADEYNEARSVYHQKLASAAVSSVKIHSVVMLTNEGTHISDETYRHEVVNNGE